MAATERRIVLVGKTGNGKSSTGNSLLGRSAFKTDCSPASVTQDCQFRKCTNCINGMSYTIVDTPGLMDTDVKLGQRLLEVLQAVELCPEPHAFLLIFSSTNRMTKDETFTVDLLRVLFGEEVFDHCIIVFTNARRFKTENEFTQFWKRSEKLGKLVEKCGGRITRIENESSVDQGDNGYINDITDRIETITEGGRKTYNYKWIKEHKTAIREHVETYDGSDNLQEELSVLVQSLGKVLSPNVWQVVLVGGTLLTVGAVGVGAAGYGVYLAGQAAVGMIASSDATRTAVANSVSAVGSAVVAKASSLASKVKFW